MNAKEYSATEWVVVGVDGSPQSEAAVRYAVEEARRRRAGVRIVHAMPVFPWGVGPGVVPNDVVMPTGRKLLAGATHVAHEIAGDVPVETRLLVGDRREAIAGAADDDGFEIILGHDLSPSLLRLSTGSTVNGVAARAPIPVIAVAPDGEGTSHGRIAVGVKDPAGAEGVLRWGLEVASERGASLWVVNAWEMAPGYEALASTPGEREEIARSATQQIEIVLGRLAADFPEVECKVSIMHGNPARTLEQVSHECDLVVLARRKHLLPRGHIGGTARAVLHHAACPVMIVPAVDPAREYRHIAGVESSVPAGATSAT